MNQTVSGHCNTLRIFAIKYPELIKEVDFSFSSRTFYLVNGSPMNLIRSTVKNFYKTWENNFLAYLECNVFDEIKISVY